MPSSPDPIYTPESVPLFEALYGKNLISLGSRDAIDNMFSDLDLKELKILDIGFGLGGVAFYLAKTYQIQVAGVEVPAWMVEHAKQHAPQEIAHLLTFAVYDQAGNLPFESASFDLVYSKGVLNHVRDKAPLFRQIYRVLKQDGLFVIADWIYPELTIDESSPLVNETKESYQTTLEEAGFEDIHFRDDSKIFLIYVKNLLNNITKHREFIENKYGSEIFSRIWDDHQKLVKDINLQRKFAVRITARKK